MPKKIKKVPKQFQRVLWSYDISKMDLEKDKKEIITQVLNYGTWEELKLLYKLYSEKEIKEVIKNPRRGVWFKKVLNFWTKIYNIKLKKEVFERAIFR
jgi:hypothetical protein